eukprot:Rmarinus@m.10646
MFRIPTLIGNHHTTTIKTSTSTYHTIPRGTHRRRNIRLLFQRTLTCSLARYNRISTRPHPTDTLYHSSPRTPLTTRLALPNTLNYTCLRSFLPSVLLLAPLRPVVRPRFPHTTLPRALRMKRTQTHPPFPVTLIRGMRMSWHGCINTFLPRDSPHRWLLMQKVGWALPRCYLPILLHMRGCNLRLTTCTPGWILLLIIPMPSRRGRPVRESSPRWVPEGPLASLLTGPVVLTACPSKQLGKSPSDVPGLLRCRRLTGIFTTVGTGLRRSFQTVCTQAIMTTCAAKRTTMIPPTLHKPRRPTHVPRRLPSLRCLRWLNRTLPACKVMIPEFLRWPPQAARAPSPGPRLRRTGSRRLEGVLVSHVRWRTGRASGPSHPRAALGILSQPWQTRLWAPGERTPQTAWGRILMLLTQ